MLLCSICVCSTEGVKEFDGIVYCIGVVTFLGDSGVKRAEITDCSSRMDPQLDKIYQCFCCSILARRDLWLFYHFLFQRRQIPTVLLRGVLGYLLLSKTCSHLFPQFFRSLRFIYFFVCLSTWSTITSLQKLIQSQVVSFPNWYYFLIYLVCTFVGCRRWPFGQGWT